MKNHKWFLPVLAVLMMTPGLLQGKPGDGFSISIGGGNNEYTAQQSADNVDQSAFYVEFGYQFALGETFSIAIIGGEGGGGAKIASLPNVDFMKFGHLVLQGRYWFGNIFLGVHAGVYSLGTTEDGYSGASISTQSSGKGVAIGKEWDGGWFVTASIDRADGLVLDNGPTYEVSSTILVFGYRWK